MDNLSHNIGFAPIANKQAKILILGSMPSQASLQKQQYYGHQRNAFWPIMQAMFKREVEDYPQGKKMLLDNYIALWDVIKSGDREGSLDTAIEMKSIIINDFSRFFAQHTAIKKVCFNGLKAESMYIKWVLPAVKIQSLEISYCRLPSTSPAYAAMSLEQKKDAWNAQIKSG